MLRVRMDANLLNNFKDFAERQQTTMSEFVRSKIIQAIPQKENSLSCDSNAKQNNNLHNSANKKSH